VLVVNFLDKAAQDAIKEKEFKDEKDKFRRIQLAILTFLQRSPSCPLSLL
jgi:hypothetical protein